MVGKGISSILHVERISKSPHGTSASQATQPLTMSVWTSPYDMFRVLSVDWGHYDRVSDVDVSVQYVGVDLQLLESVRQTLFACVFSEVFSPCIGLLTTDLVHLP